MEWTGWFGMLERFVLNRLDQICVTDHEGVCYNVKFMKTTGGLLSLLVARVLRSVVPCDLRSN